jgi:putative ABC transport system permease protein
MPHVSVEQEAAARLGLKVGSTITFEIQGKKLAAQVSSIRHVDWSGMTPNFYFIFQPGGLSAFSVSYVSAVYVPSEKEVDLQQEVVNAFPNVTAIPVREVLENVSSILKRIGWVIQFIALFSILAGLTVLVSALTATRYQRLRESAILKVVGATRLLIAKGFAVEYVILGTAAGVISASLALLVDFTVVRYVMDTPWVFQPGVLAAGIAGMILLAVLVGFLSTYRILGKRPLPVLRSE